MKRVLGILLLCLMVACQSDQEIHFNRINDLQLQLVDFDLKNNIKIAQELVIEIENYVSEYSDSTTMPDYNMQLGDLYTQALQLPIKG